MINAIWRFLVFRLAGGRILLALTVLNWLRRRIVDRRAATATTTTTSTTTYGAPR